MEDSPTSAKNAAGDEEIWSVDLFVRELDNLIDYLNLRSGFDLYGRGWGGMSTSQYATLHPKGLHKLILADSPASLELVFKGEEQLRQKLPKGVLELIERCEREGTTGSKEYEVTIEVWRKWHIKDRNTNLCSSWEV